MFYVDLHTMSEIQDDQAEATITSQLREELLATKEALEEGLKQTLLL